MALNGLIGLGLKVGFATASPHVWNKIEQVLDCTIPTFQSDKIDTTVHGTSRFKRNIPGMATVSDMKIKCLRDSYSSECPNQNAMFAYLASSTDLYWRIEIPADTNTATTLFEAYEFLGRVFAFNPMAPIMQRQEVDIDVVFDGSFFTRYEPYASQLG